MYQVNLIMLPKGHKLNDYIVDIYNEAETIEEAKDKIFRLTYKFALDELKKHQHMTTIEDGLGDMAVAFTKTFNHFDPTKEVSSFMNYYKLAIKTEIMNTKFRKYRNTEAGRKLCYRMEANMGSLDEPVKGREDLESGTKGDLIPSEYDIDKDILDNDIKRRVLEIGNKAFDSAARTNEEYRPIFLYYLKTCTEGKPTNAKALARKFDIPYANIRRMLIKYTPIFMEMWKGENDYENR